MAPALPRKVLVANRGEIARRVFTACRGLGIGTVAVYSDPDADAPFVADADEAVALSGTTAAETYLDVGKLIEAAGRTGADAGHVGIGPPAQAIEAMGSKLRARDLMEEAGVPIVPGAELSESGDPGEVAGWIGFPLLAKASAGGGGKGMRAISGPEEVTDAIEGARREAEAAFGDGTVFLERLVERPRHVEIQVFADQAGETVSLFERECSIQRRHQKVVEESPSVAVDEALRARMGEAAVAAAKAVGYVGAGTVEFLLTPEGEFFFLEMNTRLQVEHPVTELVTGLDLVRLQILIAAGEALPAEAREASVSGHAIEVRLYAEDAAGGFLPQTGTVSHFAMPAAEPFAVPAPGAPLPAAGVRLDSGIADGSEVSPHYDPMLAKVIAWAPTRAEAASRLAGALAAAEVDGLVTNRDFLVRVLSDADFIAGETDTGFLERHEGLAAPLVGSDAIQEHALAAALAAMAERRERAPVLGFLPAGWRNVRWTPQRISFEAPGGDEVEVPYWLDREHRVRLGDGTVSAGLVEAKPGRVVLEVEGVRRAYRVRRSGEMHHVNGPDGQVSLRELPRYPSAEAALGEGALQAPMPGKVLALRVGEGDAVEAGQVVAVLEAMKMEHELTAPVAGSVSELPVVEGEQVESGAVIVVVDPTAEGEAGSDGTGEDDNAPPNLSD